MGNKQLSYQDRCGHWQLLIRIEKVYATPVTSNWLISTMSLIYKDDRTHSSRKSPWQISVQFVSGHSHRPPSRKSRENCSMCRAQVAWECSSICHRSTAIWRLQPILSSPRVPKIRAEIGDENRYYDDSDGPSDMRCWGCVRSSLWRMKRVWCAELSSYGRHSCHKGLEFLPKNPRVAAWIFPWDNLSSFEIEIVSRPSM